MYNKTKVKYSSPGLKVLAVPAPVYSNFNE